MADKNTKRPCRTAKRAKAMRVRELEVVYRPGGKTIPLQKINCPEDLREHFSDLERYDREHFYVVHLNTHNEIIGYERASVGTVTQAVICPREIFKAVLLSNASSVILIHNHPSGHAEPSAEDKHTTSKLKKAADLLGLKLIGEMCFVRLEN